ncbi:hypothetical protein ABZS96_42490 [Streptomyces avermitilis]|uniref:hypothetical protein n=2 Tax=Streptomyces avermitilis TaxID=33903 RepID=UPI0033BF396B
MNTLNEFRVSCSVSPEAALEMFPELKPVVIAEQTVLYGPVLDQAHLFGLLARFRTYRLPLTEMRPLPTRSP